MSDANEVTWSDYDAFLKDAEKDTRVGDHDFVVTDTIKDQWDSGDDRYKFRGVLATAGNAKADFTLSPPPSPAVIAAESASWAAGKKRAIAAGISMQKTLSKSYGKTLDTIEVGDVFRVKTAKNKEGFIRIIAILDKSKVGAAAAAEGKAVKDVPF